MQHDPSFVPPGGYPAHYIRQHHSQGAPSLIRQPSRSLAPSHDAATFSSFAGGQNGVVDGYSVAAPQTNVYASGDVSLTRQAHSLDAWNLGVNDHVSKQASQRHDYDDGHTSQWPGARNTISAAPMFVELPAPYLLSPDLNHSPANLLTPLSTPGLMSHSESQSDYFGRDAANSITLDGETESKPHEVRYDASSDSQIRKKRGRPKSEKSRAATTRESDAGEKMRMPHNEVERKYRESLNVGFERLRASVPTLPENNPISGSTVQKQSKAAVLGAAIEYIKHLEAETERLKGKNASLKQNSEEIEGKSRRINGAIKQENDPL